MRIETEASLSHGDLLLVQIDEETGIDVTNMIQEDAKIECWFQDQFTQLYIIPGIQTDSMVQPKLRKEIRVGTGLCCIFQHRRHSANTE